MTAGMASVAIRRSGRSTSWVPVSLALAQRSLVGILRIPAAVVPLVVMPMFFVIAFSGSFRSLADLPSFPTDNVINWFMPFAIIQGAAFAGFGTGFSTVRDIESGFYDRLLLAPGSRLGLWVGPTLAGLARATFTTAVVLVLGFVLGAELVAPALGLLALWAAALGVAIMSTGWALGVVYRIPDTRAGPILQIGIFFTMFLSTGNVPVADQIGWTKQIAEHNPLTPILELARQGFLGDVAWDTTWPGLVAIALSSALLWLFAVTGLKHRIP
jgi:ABC-2 type transport system permease protein